MAITILETERLILRSIVKADEQEIHRVVFSDADVMRYVFAGAPLSFTETQQLISEKFDHKGSGQKLGIVADRSSGVVMGFAGLLSCIVLGANDFEIGFVLGKKFWHKGYATEVGRAQLEYGFTKTSCERLLAQVATENLASKSTLARIGMRYHSIISSPERGMREVYIAHKDAAKPF